VDHSYLFFYMHPALDCPQSFVFYKPRMYRGTHADKFRVKYKDDPNWWTHSLLREGYGKDQHWVLLGLPSRDSV